MSAPASLHPVLPTGQTYAAEVPDTLDLAERVNDQWCEEYGDPDGDHEIDEAALAAELLPALTAAVARTTVWSCSQVAERTYSAEEVLAMMREDHPSWFKEGA